MEPKFNVILIGAGDINFGTVEGPWNHSARLEALLGPRLHVLSVIDPDTERSRRRIENKCREHGGCLAQCWSHATAHADVHEAARDHGEERIDLVILGCPPQFRGTLAPRHDMEVQVIKAFPRLRGLFVEKPVASIDPTVMASGGSLPCHAVAHALEQWVNEQQGRVVSVGYMFRYLAAVHKIRDLIQKHHLVPRLINARYFMAYESTTKVSWWSKAASGGPIVEQATHLVDLIRYIAAGVDEESNPVLMSSVEATTTENTDEAGHLSAIPIDEGEIAIDDRVPRATAAMWRHAKGTIATLCHSVALYDKDYHAEMDIIADGWMIQLQGIYTGKPTLVVRSPKSEYDERTVYNDDPFATELAAMIEAVKAGSNDTRSASINGATDSPADTAVLSSFRDAVRTYELTWAIRRAGERKVAVRKQQHHKQSRLHNENHSEEDA